MTCSKTTSQLTSAQSEKTLGLTVSQSVSECCNILSVAQGHLRMTLKTETENRETHTQNLATETNQKMHTIPVVSTLQ